MKSRYTLSLILALLIMLLPLEVLNNKDVVNFFTTNQSVIEYDIDDVTSSNFDVLEESIDKAMSEYNELSDEDKELYKDDYAKLQELQTTVDVIDFQTTHNDLLLLDNDELDLTDEDALEEAHRHFNTLPLDAQAELHAEKAILDALIEKMEVLQESNTFELDNDSILDETTMSVEVTDKESIIIALTEYDDLSPEAQMELSAKKTLLDNLLMTVGYIEDANEFKDTNDTVLELDVNTITLRDKMTLEASIDQYSSLSDEVKALLVTENTLLQDLMNEIEVQEEVVEFVDSNAMTLALTNDTVEITDREQIEMALAEYALLSPEAQGKAQAEKDLLDSLLLKVRALEGEITFTLDNDRVLQLTPTTVQISDRADVEVALADYDLLSEDLKVELSPLKTLLDSLLEEIEVLEEISEFTNDNQIILSLTPSSVDESNKDDIELALVEFESLSDEAKAALNPEETLLKDLLTEIEVLEEVNTFTTDNESVLTETPLSINIADKGAVVIALTEYDLLSNEAQAKLNPEKSLLDTLLTEIIVLEEVQTFTTNNDTVLSETPATIELSDKATVEAAIAELDSLSEAAKAKLDSEKLLLDELLVEIEIQEAVFDYRTNHESALELSPLDVAITDKTIVQNAINDYNSLGDSEKAILMTEKSLLDSLLLEIELLEEIDTFKVDNSEMLAEVIDTIETSDKPLVESALSEYELLSDNAKSELVDEKALLDSLLEEIEAEMAATEFKTDNDDSLQLTTVTVQISDKASVEAAIADYDLLSPLSKSKVADERDLLYELLARIAVLENVDNFESDHGLPLSLTVDTVTVTDEAAVEAALDAYDLLDAPTKLELTDQKALLDDLEAKIVVLKEANTFKNNNDSTLQLTVATVEPTDKAAVEASLAEYDLLSNEAKTELTSEKALLDSLLVKIDVLEAAETFNTDHVVVLSKTPATVELSDKAMIETALNDYNLLSPDVKTELESEKALLDSLLAEISALEESNTFKTDYASVLAETKATIEVTDKVAVETALTEYDLLDTATKAKLTTEKALLDSLLVEIEILEDVNTFKADNSLILLETPVSIETSDRGSLDSALAEYDLLSPQTQTKLTTEKALLDSLLIEIEVLEDVELFITDNSSILTETPSSIEISDKVEVQNALADYDSLSAEAQDYLNTEKAQLDNLLTEINILEEIQTYIDDNQTLLDLSPITVTPSSKTDIENALQNYALLSEPARNALTTEHTLLTNLLNEIEILEELELFIDTHTTVLDLTEETVDTSDKALVEAALADYDMLTPESKYRLSNEKALLDSLLSEIETQEDVESFKNNHNTVLDLTEETVETSDKAAVEAALAEYDLLDDQAKLRLVNEKDLLDRLLSTIEDKENKSTFLIDNAYVLSKTPATIDLTDKALVIEALNEYDMLNPTIQLDLAAEKILLDDLLTEIVILEEVNTFTTDNNSVLSETPATIKISDKLAVQDALSEYELLSSEAQADLAPEKVLLDELLAEIATLESVSLFEIDNAPALSLSPSTVSITDKSDVQDALTEYNSLSEDSKAELGPEKALLDSLLAEIEVLEDVDLFITNNNPVLSETPATIEISDKTSVASAFTEFDSLSSEAQAELGPEKALLDSLQTEIEVLEEVNTFQIDNASILSETPATIELSDRTNVESALTDYNLLSVGAKAKLSPEKALLDSLLEEIEILEEVNTFITTHSMMLSETPATIQITDRVAVETALADYDSLSAESKAKLSPEKVLLDSLLAEIIVLEEANTFLTNNNTVLAETPATVEIADKAAVQAALTDYDSLSPEAMAKVNPEKVLLDSLLTEIIILEEVQSFVTDNASALAETPATIEITDKAVVETALTEFDLLSAEAKAELGPEKALLDSLLTEIEVLEEAEAFITNNTSVLSETPGTIEITDKAAVETALTEFDLLSIDAQAELGPEKALLDSLLTEIEVLEEAESFITNNTSVLAETPATIETTDKAAVEAALTEYDLLSTEAQAELVPEKALLDSLLAEIIVLEDVNTFVTDNSVVLTETPGTIEISDKAAVEAALAEYDLLTTEAQTELGPEKVLLDSLLAEIEVLEEADAFVTDNMIVLTETPATIEITDKASVEEALAEYDLLSAEAMAKVNPEKALLDSLLAEIIILEDAQTFTTNNSAVLTETPGTIEVTDRAAVESALTEYDLLSTEAQAELEPEKTLLDSLLAEIVILEEAQTFTTDNSSILTETPASIEISDKAAVETALTEYDLLSAEAQAELGPEKALLDSLLAEIEVLEEVQTFTTDNSSVLSETPGTIEVTDRATVETALTEYDLLSAEAKAELDPEKTLLDSLLAEIVILEEAQTFTTDNASVLAETPATIEISDKAAVETALIEYDLLSSEAQAELGPEKALLDSLLAEIEVLEDVNTFTTDNSVVLTETPGTIEISDKATVESALNDFNLLSSEAQAKLGAEKALLDSLLSEIEVLEDVDTFKTDNASVLAETPATIEVTDKAAVETALTEYDLLSSEAQAELGPEKALLDSLLAEIEVLEDADTFQADNASVLAETPATIEITDKAAVEAALAEFDLLSSEAQAELGPEKTLLDTLLAEIEVLEEAQTFTTDNASILAETPGTIEVSDKAAVEAALTEYDSLSAEAQAELGPEKTLLDSLLAEIEVLEDANTFLSDNSSILAETPGTIEISDKAAVEAAIAEYNLLSPSAQAEVTAEKELLDNLLAEIVILEDANTFLTDNASVLSETPGTIEISDKVAVEAALTEYDLLTVEAQAEVTPEKALLDSLLVEIEILEDVNTFLTDNASVLTETPGTIEVSDKAAVEAAIAEYDLLSPEAKAKLGAEKTLLDSLLAEIVVLEEVDTFKTDHSSALGLSVLSVELTDKAIVEAALTSYDTLSNEAKNKLVPEKDLLDSLITKIELLEEIDTFKTDNTVALSLTTETVDTSDKAIVEAALAEYDVLTDDAKSELIDEKALLDDLLEDIEYQEEANTFKSNNSATLTLTTVTVQISDKAAVNSAIDEYDLLNMGAQVKVTPERDLLYELKARIAVLESADSFESDHALPLSLTLATVTVGDEAAVQAALDDYELLDPATKLALVNEKVLLDDLKDEIDVLKDVDTFVTNNSATLALTNSSVQVTDKIAVQAALAEYDTLSAEAKAKLGTEKALLDSLLAKILVLEDVDTFEADNSVVLTKTPATIVLSDKAAVETALTEYDLLSAEAKAELVTEKALLDSLLAEIEVLEDVDTFKTDNALVLTETPGTIEVSDKAAVETALTEYDLLSVEAQAKLGAEKTLLDSLLAEIEVLEDVNTFNADNALVLTETPGTIGISDKAAVETALTEYGLLTAEAQAKLGAEKTLLDSLLAEIVVLEDVDSFETDNALVLTETPGTIEISDKATVEAALAEYDLLSAEAKAELGPEKALLDSLLAEIVILEDAQTFKTDNSSILAETPATIEISDKAAVEAALAEYDLLSTEAQAELDPEKILLDSLLAEIVVLENVQTFVTDNASVLAETPVTIEISDKAAVEAALAEYDLLSAEAKADLGPEKTLLDSLLAEIEVLEDAQTFKVDNALVLTETPGTIEISDKAAVEAALAEYDLLAAEAQAELGPEKTLLDSLLAEIVILEDAQTFVVDNASVLAKTPGTIEISDKVAVETALTEYNLLSAEAKAELGPEKALLDSLLAEIEVLEDAQTFKADNASVLAETPATIEISDKVAVEAALAEFDLLTPEAQAKLGAEKTLLDSLLAEIVILEDAQTFVTDNASVLSETPSTIVVTDKAAVEAALAEYNLLTPEAQAELGPEKALLDSLLAEIIVLEDAATFATDNASVLSETPGTIAISDKASVQTALAEYNLLTPEAQAELGPEKVLLDSLLVEIIILEDVDEFVTNNALVLSETPGTIEVTDKATVEAALAEYNLLTPEAQAELGPEKALLDSLLAEIIILEDAETFVTDNAVILSETPGTIEITDKATVEAALAEYNLLSTEAQAELGPEKALLDSLLAEIEVLEDAETFVTDNAMVLAETPATIEISDKAAVEAALAEYDSLSANVQAKVNPEKVLLDSLLAEIEVLEDVNTFTTDNSAVLSETPGTVEITDKAAVEAALAEYDLLSAEAQAELGPEKALLDSLLEEIIVLEDADTFLSDNASVLSETPGTIEISDKASVQTALAEYNLLTPEAKAELGPEKALLDSLLVEIIVLEDAATFTTDNASVLAETPATIEISDKAAVETALAEFDLLTPEAQAELGPEKALLDSLLAEIIVLEDAETFTSDNASVLAETPASIEISDKAAVEAALAEFDLLSAEAQAELGPEKALLDSLLAEIIVLEDANTFTTDNSTVLNETPGTIEVSDKAAVEAALAEYDLLSAEAQAKLGAEKALLDSLLAEIVILEDVNEFVTDNTAVLAETPATIEISDKAAVEAALAEYDLLTAEAKAELGAEKALLDSLLVEIIILEDANTFTNNNSMVLAETPASIEIADKAAVEAALAEYDLLSAEAKAELGAEKALLDSLLAEIVILEDANTFVTDNAVVLNETPSTIEISDKVAVETALAEYNLLTAEAKAELGPEKALLDSLLAEIVILEDVNTFVTDNSSVLNETPGTIEISDKASVQTALAEYDLLTAEAKAEIVAEKALLDSLLAEIVVLEDAETFVTDNAVVLTETPATIEISDKAAVEAALAEYDLLSIEAQAEVSPEKLLLDTLLEEITVLEEIESFTTSHSLVLGLTLETVDQTNKAAIETALAEYDLLSTETKNRLSSEKALLDSLLAEIIAVENSEFIDFEEFYEPALITETISINGRDWLVNNVALDCNPSYDVCIDTKALALKSGAFFESQSPFINGIDKITLSHGALNYDNGSSFAFKVEYELQSNPGVWLTLQDNGTDLLVDVLTGDNNLTYVEIDVNITESVNIRFVPVISDTVNYINLDNITIFRHVDPS